MLQILHEVVIGKFKLRRSLKQAIFSLSVGDMLYSRYEEQSYHRFKGLKAQTIAKILVEEERLGVTRQGAQSFLKRYRESPHYWQMARQWEAICYLRRCQGDCQGSNTGIF